MISIKQINYINNIGQRPQLEDSIFPAPGIATQHDNLFLVCDGVGGESMGEEASRIACEGFSRYFEQYPPESSPVSTAYIREAQRYVLGKLHGYAEANPAAERMSTTLTLAHLENNGVSVAWCGDSRIYHVRNGEIIWRSRDHSLVENLVKHGEISEADARKHPQKNVITRSLSAFGSPSEIDTHYLNDIRNGDYIMLCTDGVLEQIDDERLGGILESNEKDKKSLFMKYCEGNTKDNFSLYLLEMEQDEQPVAAGMSKKTIITALVAVCLVALAVVFLWTPVKNWLSSDKDGSNGNKTVPAHHTQPAKKGGADPAVPSSNTAKPSDKETNGAKVKDSITVPVPVSSQKKIIHVLHDAGKKIAEKTGADEPGGAKKENAPAHAGKPKTPKPADSTGVQKN